MADMTVGKALRPITEVEAISLVDNCVEMPYLLNRRDTVRMWDWVSDSDRAQWPRPGRGLSILVRTRIGGEKHAILFDAAFAPDAVVGNARAMCLDLSEIEAIVLSHQHWDHTGGVGPVLKALGAEGMPVIGHPAIFSPRGWRDPVRPDEPLTKAAYTLERAHVE